jgi:hypothetical protein
LRKFSSLTVPNVGTRVRIEILKAIARKISNDLDQAHAVSFISIMHIKLKNDGSKQPSRSFTFIDAPDFATLTSWEHTYAKAGKAFAGQLEQNFLVLRKSESEAAQTNFHKSRIQRGRGKGRSCLARGHGDPNRGAMRNRGMKRPVNTRRPLCQRNAILKLNNQALSSFHFFHSISF